MPDQDKSFQLLCLLSILLHGLGMLLLVQLDVVAPPARPSEAFVLVDLAPPPPAPPSTPLPPALDDTTPEPSTPLAGVAEAPESSTPEPASEQGKVTRLQPASQAVTPPPQAALSNADSIAQGALQTRETQEPGQGTRSAPGHSVQLGLTLPTIQVGGSGQDGDIPSAITQESTQQGTSQASSSADENASGGVGREDVSPAEQRQRLTRAGQKDAPLELLELMEPPPKAQEWVAKAMTSSPEQAAPPPSVEPPPSPDAPKPAPAEPPPDSGEQAPQEGKARDGAKALPTSATAPKPSQGKGTEEQEAGSGQLESTLLAASDRAKGTESRSEDTQAHPSGGSTAGTEAKAQEGEEVGKEKPQVAQEQAVQAATSILPLTEEEEPPAPDDLPEAASASSATLPGEDQEKRGAEQAQLAAVPKQQEQRPESMPLPGSKPRFDEGEGQLPRSGDPSLETSAPGRGVPTREQEPQRRPPPSPLAPSRNVERGARPERRVPDPQTTPLELREGTRNGKGSEQGQYNDLKGVPGKPKNTVPDALERGIEGSDSLGTNLRRIWGGGRRELPSVAGRASPEVLRAYGPITSRADPLWEHQVKFQEKVYQEFAKPEYGPEKTLGLQGKITYMLVQEKDGRVSSLFIVDGADLVELEALSRQVLKRSLPLPKLDPKYGKERAVLLITLIYK